MPNRLISFDFSGTLANPVAFGEFEPRYQDSRMALLSAKALHPGTYFAVITSGSTRKPMSFLSDKNMLGAFVDPTEQGHLVYGTDADFVRTVARSVPVARSLRDRITGKPVTYKEVVEQETVIVRDKPLPDMLQFAMHVCGIEDSSQVVHIGDSVDDRMMAHYAGASYIDVSPAATVRYMNMHSLIQASFEKVQ